MTNIATAKVPCNLCQDTEIKLFDGVCADCMAIMKLNPASIVSQLGIRIASLELHYNLLLDRFTKIAREYASYKECVEDVHKSNLQLEETVPSISAGIDNLNVVVDSMREHVDSMREHMADACERIRRLETGPVMDCGPVQPYPKRVAGDVSEPSVTPDLTNTGFGFDDHCFCKDHDFVDGICVACHQEDPSCVKGDIDEIGVTPDPNAVLAKTAAPLPTRDPDQGPNEYRNNRYLALLKAHMHNTGQRYVFNGEDGLIWIKAQQSFKSDLWELTSRMVELRPANSPHIGAIQEISEYILNYDPGVKLNDDIAHLK